MLVLVDIQDYFLDHARNSKPYDVWKPIFLANVKRNIEEAIDAQVPIVVLNFHGCGPLNHRVNGWLCDYPKMYRRYKYINDGGPVLHSFCKKKCKPEPKVIKLIGGNISACLEATAYSIKFLLKGEPEVTVDFSASFEEAWSVSAVKGLAQEYTKAGLQVIDPALVWLHD